jgi:hypothetical protein
MALLLGLSSTYSYLGRYTSNNYRQYLAQRGDGRRL